MKINKLVTIALMVLSVISFQAARAQSLPTSSKWHWDKVTLVVEISERLAGLHHVLRLTADPTNKESLAFVGLGMRGSSAVIPFCLISDDETVGLFDDEK